MRHSVVVIVACLALAVPAVGQERQPTVSDDAYVAELLAIVEKTNSPDALLIALFRLRDAKADPRRVIPAAIRGGERLRIFGNHLLRMDDPNFAHATVLAELITAIGQPPAVDLKVAVERRLVESEALRQIQEEWQQFWLRQHPFVRLGWEVVTVGDAACQVSSSLDQPRPVQRDDFRIVPPPATWPPRPNRSPPAEQADERTPRLPALAERPATDPVPSQAQVLGQPAVSAPATDPQVAQGNPPAGRHTSRPNISVQELLVDSENLRQIQAEWQRFWLLDHPSTLTWDRVTGVVGPGLDSSQPAPQRPTAGNDFRTPHIPPIVERPAPDPSPALEQILGQLPPSPAIPGVVAGRRDDVRVVVEQVEKASHPARFFPLVGPARLQLCRWKCTVYFNQRLALEYPVAFAASWPTQEVVYVETEHLEVVPAGKP